MEFWKFFVLGEAGIDLKLPFGQRDRIPNNTVEDYYDWDDKFYPETKHSLKTFRLSEESTEVDFISGSVELGGSGFFISEKALDVLINYNIPPYEILDIDICLFDGTPTQKKYKWLHLLKKDEGKNINFDKSSIFKQKNEEQAKISSHNQLITIHDDFDWEVEILKKEVVIENNYMDVNAPDMFYLRGISMYHIISDKLKKAIEKNALSGLFPFEQFEMIKVY